MVIHLSRNPEYQLHQRFLESEKLYLKIKQIKETRGFEKYQALSGLVKLCIL